MTILNLDFETRSEIDLTRVGAEKYARHKSTHILCASFQVNKGPMMQWRPWSRQEIPITLQKALLDDDVEIHAWNAAFERQILKHVMRMPLAPSRFRCTQARARSMALPGKLELCAKALKMPIQKADSRIMMKWCKPLPSGGWADDRAEYEQLCAYCDVDVETEEGLGEVLRVLTHEEQRDWEINEIINDRGIPIDLDLVRGAQFYANDEMLEIKQELTRITGGMVTSPKQFQRLKDWLPMELEVDSLDAAARAALLDDDEIQGDVREVIQLVDDGGRASTAKFAVMEARADENDRVHGAYIFNGAGQTGRYSSTGAQLHNFVKDKLANPEAVVDAILARRPKEEIMDISGLNVLTTLSRLLRPSIVAANGNQLVWGDWSAIEARVLPWLSQENSASSVLALFAAGKDVYLDQASKMFGVLLEAVTKDQRQAGKVAVLSLGFGGGAGAYKSMAKKYGLVVEDDLAEMYKRTWRAANPWAQRFWNALETAIFNAVRNPGEVFTAGRVSYMCNGDVLWCLLPCGRMLSYPFPRVETIAGKFGPTEAVTCIKGSWSPKKGSNWWPRMALWGGLAAENCLGPDTSVLTDTGWKRLVDVKITDCLHDGIEWVSHQGLIYQGIKPVIDFGGVLLTCDHKVLMSGKWVAAGKTTHGLATKRFDRSKIWEIDRFICCLQQRTQTRMVDSLSMRKESETCWIRNEPRSLFELWLSSNGVTAPSKNAWHVSTSGILCMAFDVGSLSAIYTSSVEKLRSSWHSCLQTMAQIRKLLDRYGTNLRVWFNFGSTEQRQELHTKKLRLENTQTTGAQYPQQHNDRNTERSDASMRSGGNQWCESEYISLSPGSWMAEKGHVQKSSLQQSPVYDLKNAGRRHRFIVRGSDGVPFIVSNCTQGEAASLLRWTLREIADNGWLDCLIGHTHDEPLMEVPDGEVDDAEMMLEDIMTSGPAWAAGLPLAVEVNHGAVYGK